MIYRECCRTCDYAGQLSCIADCPVRIAYDESPDLWLEESKKYKEKEDDMSNEI